MSNDNRFSEQILESIQEQIGSVGAVKGEPFAHLVSLCITGISLETLLSTTTRLMVEQASKGNPPPEEVVSGFINVVTHMVASMTSAATEAAGLTPKHAQEAVDWASRITENAQKSHDAMQRLTGK